jgi:hypothetical protein
MHLIIIISPSGCSIFTEKLICHSIMFLGLF